MIRKHFDGQTDLALVAVCNEGGKRAERAFETLYRRHRDYVLRVALRFTADRDLAADALQETFTYLLKRFPPTGDGLKLTARLTTYLYPIAKNYAISAVRREQRFATAASEPDELAAPAVASTGAIDAALAGLSPDRREVLVLRFVDDMSLAEIAAVLEIPLGTVKSRLHLAIRSLRDNPEIRDLFEP